jgi:acetyl-CoA acetyltransferase
MTTVALYDSVIVGYAETKIVARGVRDIWELHAELIETLLEGSGIEKPEVDGLVMASSLTGTMTPFWAESTAEMLGLELDFCEQVHTGGCGAVGAVARAAMAIDYGLCDVVLLLNADTPTLEDNYRDRSFGPEWVAPYGQMGPPGAFGLLASRYDHEYGLDFEALGSLAVTQRDHALLNSNACEKLRTAITIEDYLNSRMISEPIRLLDCVMTCDGGNGLLMMSRRRARQKRMSHFVVPIGYAERTNHLGRDPLPDVTETGHRVAGPTALRQAGLAPQDIGSFHPYDDFLLAILLQLEMFGFCEKGQGSAFIRATDLHFDGDLPLNTGGGQISAGQAGLAGGGTNLVEAVRQLFGAGGARQVPNTANALVTGIGWIGYGRNWGTSAALVLTPDR